MGRTHSDIGGGACEEDKRNFFEKNCLLQEVSTAHALYVIYKILYVYYVEISVHATQVRAYNISLYTRYIMYTIKTAHRGRRTKIRILLLQQRRWRRVILFFFFVFFFLMFGTRENKSFRIPEKCPFNRGPDE